MNYLKRKIRQSAMIIMRRLKKLRQATELLSLLTLIQVSRLTLRLRHLINLNPRHKIAILIILSFLTDLIFTLFEFNAEVYKHWHPYFDGMTFSDGRKWDGSVTDANFAYGFFGIGSRGLMFLAGWLAIHYRMYPKSFLVAFWLELFDMPDYYFTRNSWWKFIPKVDFWLIDNWTFEYNYIKILAICLIVYHEWKKLHGNYSGSLEHSAGL